MVFVELACGKGRHSYYYFAKVYVCTSVCRSGFVRAIPPTVMHGFQNYLTVIVLEKEKCHLKYFLR